MSPENTMLPLPLSFFNALLHLVCILSPYHFFEITISTLSHKPLSLSTLSLKRKLASDPCSTPEFKAQRRSDRDGSEVDRRPGQDHFNLEAISSALKQNRGHYKWALDQLFYKHKFSRVIILEDDMEISPDFFDYFAAGAALLDRDKSIMAISSWNDNGQRLELLNDLVLLQGIDYLKYDNYFNDGSKPPVRFPVMTRALMSVGHPILIRLHTF
ncbi:hypothetical protein ACS0TY_017391 [Phlomoides rotata]